MRARRFVSREKQKERETRSIVLRPIETLGLPSFNLTEGLKLAFHERSSRGKERFEFFFARERRSDRTDKRLTISSFSSFHDLFSYLSPFILLACAFRYTCFVTCTTLRFPLCPFYKCNWFHRYMYVSLCMYWFPTRNYVITIVLTLLPSTVDVIKYFRISIRNSFTFSLSK